MRIDGKRGDIQLDDLTASASSMSTRLHLAKAVVGEVRGAVSAWASPADAAGVPEG